MFGTRMVTALDTITQGDRELGAGQGQDTAYACLSLALTVPRRRRREEKVMELNSILER